MNTIADKQTPINGVTIKWTIDEDTGKFVAHYVIDRDGAHRRILIGDRESFSANVRYVFQIVRAELDELGIMAWVDSRRAFTVA